MQSIQKIRSQVGVVFWVSVVLSVAFILWGSIFTANLDAVTKPILGFVVFDLGWLYLLVTTSFLAFALFLAFSRYGRIRLGKKGEEPEFGRFSWFAMLFQAGMGIGIVFWGVSEPVTYFAVDPPYGQAPPNSTAAADLAMQYSFFHWALHPWAIYAVVGLAIAYFNFRKDRPGLVSAVFYPLLGDRVNGPIGKAIDVLAVLATLFGVAVSLGLGTLQINAGLSSVFGTPNGLGMQFLIIVITAIVFMASAATGVGRGVKWLSNASLVVAAALILYILVVGPTVIQLNAFTQGIGDYLHQIISMSLRMNAFEQDPWLGKWTLFYFATWISWAPYVGAFIARISRGRTIREFVFGTLIAPSVVTFLWYAVFGAAAIDLDSKLGGTISQAAQSDPAIGLFAFLQEYPLPIITALVAIVLVFIFFVAGADAATIVLGRMSTGGTLNPNPVIQLVWGVLMAAFAAVLLLVGEGGLFAMEKVSILIGLPFGIVMVAMCVSLYKVLAQDAREGGLQEEEPQERDHTAEESTRQPA